MKKVLLHLVGIGLYFPLCCTMFLYLVLQPDKMNTFYMGLGAILDIFENKRIIRNNNGKSE